MSNSNADIQIKVVADMTQATKQLQSGLKVLAAPMLKSAQQTRQQMSSMLNQLSSDYGRSLAKQLKFQSSWAQDVNAMVNKTTSKVPAIGKVFYGSALSIMFAGYQIQRMSQQVITWGVKAFDEVAHSIMGNVTQTDRLNGAMLYLGYTIGNALQPVLGWLVPIISAIASWVAENPGLVQNGLIIAGILGTVMALGGSLTLLNSGLSATITSLTGIKSTMGGLQGLSIGVGLVLAADAYDAFKKGDILTGVANSLEAAGFIATGAGKSGAGAALVAIGVALQFTSALLSGKPITKDSVASWLITLGGGIFILNPVAGGALLAIGIGLSFVSTDFLKQMVKVLQVMGQIILTFGAVLVDAMVTPLIAIINAIIMAYNLLTGSSTATIPYFSLTKAAGNQLKSLADSYYDIGNSTNTPTSGMAAPSLTPGNISGIKDYNTAGPYNGATYNLYNATVHVNNGSSLPQALQQAIQMRT